VASVLVIDDDRLFLSLVRRLLEEQGHEVRCAGHGVEGLTAYRQQPADVVLCDLFMPEKEGLETIRELRSEFPDARIIATSGGSTCLGGADFLGMARMFGAAAVLSKPFDAEALVEAVRSLLPVGR